MDIFVEIGTEDQKELIKSELLLIETILDICQSLAKVKQVIVPQNFDAKIDELLNTNSLYKSQRETQVAVAKVLKFDDGITIIINPLLYTIGYDGQIRLLIYIHETFHAINGDRFPIIQSQSPSDRRNLSNLNVMYDEYCAVRISLEIVEKNFLSKSQLYKRHVSAAFKSQIRALINEKIYYEKIKREILRFRLFLTNIEQHLEVVGSIFDQAIKDIAYSYAYIDYKPRNKRFEPILLKSKFINNNSRLLIEFIRSKYQDNDFDLIGGLNLMANVMTNFGLKFEDIPTGEYCHVLDI
jgi:hypothetical protein